MKVTFAFNYNENPKKNDLTRRLPISMHLIWLN